MIHDHLVRKKAEGVSDGRRWFAAALLPRFVVVGRF